MYMKQHSLLTNHSSPGPLDKTLVKPMQNLKATYMYMSFNIHTKQARPWQNKACSILIWVRLNKNIMLH